MTEGEESYPKLHFGDTFAEIAWELEYKGWYGGATVELENGARYPVFFYDPVRLAQDLLAEAEQGRPYVAEAGMIVVPLVSEANMRLAVGQLYKAGWFDHLQPISAPEW